MERTAPADVARAAMDAVQTRRRDDWLAMFSRDARVEDPVGHVPPIEDGEGLAAFWDNGVAGLKEVRFDIDRAWETGEEAVLHGTVSIVTATGQDANYDGVFAYRLDEQGKIAALRAFWDLPDVIAQLGAA